MLTMPTFQASTQIVLIRANNKPSLEVMIDDLYFCSVMVI